MFSLPNIFGYQFTMVFYRQSFLLNDFSIRAIIVHEWSLEYDNLCNIKMTFALKIAMNIVYSK